MGVWRSDGAGADFFYGFGGVFGFTTKLDLSVVANSYWLEYVTHFLGQVSAH